ncbi:MAG: S-methyl-5-thioribose-1-phosphate isomerase, partial [Betaproteobacteria bacterium]|nr:S-methyl-5-thioribose-1-phosphate isomerase [Betaproteobacteria bacterium]
MSGFETLRWRGGRLELLDQRALPAERVYLTFDSSQAVAAGIRDMVVRGAPAIGCAAAYGVALEALRLKAARPDEFRAGLERALDELSKSRPTAVNLFWALERMSGKLKALGGAGQEAVAAALLAEAHAIREEDVRLNRQLGAHGERLLADGARVLTHCNAGALATAGHGTALGVVRSAVAAGKRIHMFVN